ncbi:MAG: thiamine-phosphate kinase [Gloeomargaritaceae cyanobacterium C42_A2020_066]|nr:thiamine-phosphate kinase [Gloeomargaritaceae cyanobacterium C42_A2020_066]
MAAAPADVPLSVLGEQGLLARLHRFCPPEVIGDDGAKVPWPAGRPVVVTTDVLVEGVHFSASPCSPLATLTMTPEDLGWRAVAVNYSDLAAMGATPVGITVGLTLPPHSPVAWVEAVYAGMAECLGVYGGVILGGDVVRGTTISLAITALGATDGEANWARSAAQPGDALVVTGWHGASRAGLALLLGEDSAWAAGLSPEARQRFQDMHQRPRPRLDVLPGLAELVGQRAAVMDTSDGLADALIQVCRASGVAAAIDRPAVPYPPELDDLPPEQRWQWILYGGEDFELLLSLPPAQAELLVTHLGRPAARIGRVVAGSGVTLVDSTQATAPIALNLQQGYQHFA